MTDALARFEEMAHRRAVYTQAALAEMHATCAVIECTTEEDARTLVVQARLAGQKAQQTFESYRTFCITSGCYDSTELGE
jgi:hypothetical protein